MLHITASTKTLREELRIARGVIRDIMSVLSDHKSLNNLTQQVGIFVIEMPDFKVLARDADSGKQLLRKVCSGEVKPMDAYLKLNTALEEVNSLLNVLDSVTTF